MEIYLEPPRLGGVFELPKGGGTIASLVSSGSDLTDDGVWGGVAVDSNGNLYGTAAYDGSKAFGAVFELTANSPSLAYLTPPTSTIAGQSISVRVELQLTSQSLFTATPSSVTLTLSNGAFSNGSKVAVASVSGGIATFFSLTINTAGSYTLTATDGALTPLTSAPFTVSPTTSIHLVYGHQPSNVVAGVAMNPPVVASIQDSFGNVLMVPSLTLNLVNTSTNTTTPITASTVNGVATFANMTVDTVGTYDLSGTGSVGGFISSTFAVKAAGKASTAFACASQSFYSGSATAQFRYRDRGGSVRQHHHNELFHRHAHHQQRNV